MAARGIDRTAYRRRRAVLLAAEAIALEVADPAVARERATESVRLAPSLVPAAAVAGRLLGASGDLKRAAKILSAAFSATPHPDLAEAYAHLRPGDAAQDRLKRIRILAGTAPTHPESIIALAHAAIDAQEFQQARAILSPLTEKPTQRICLLMAELEAREHGDVGKAREWAARAVRAPRDPAWIADGVVSDQWAAISPVTGRLDAYAWEVPPGVTATPVLEHEAERVRNAIAAIPAPEAVLPKAAPAPEVVAKDAPAPAADVAPVEPAKPAGMNGAAPVSPKPVPAAAPIIAEPPRPDDPGPLAADEDISVPRKQ